MRESSCLLPDVLCLASYTCGPHYSLPPARLHADDMNNRSLAIKARSVGGMTDVPGRWCRPLHLDWKNSSQMVKCAAWLGGGACGERGEQAAERKLLNVSQLGREMGWGSTRQGWTSIHLDGKSRCGEVGRLFPSLCEHAHTSHTCETIATEYNHSQTSQYQGT